MPDDPQARAITLHSHHAVSQANAMTKVARESSFFDLLPMLCATPNEQAGAKYRLWRFNDGNFRKTSHDIMREEHAEQWLGFVSDFYGGNRAHFTASELADEFVKTYSSGIFWTLDALRNELENPDATRHP